MCEFFCIYPSLIASYLLQSKTLNSQSQSIENVLAQTFGHHTFRPLQREIIESALSGNPTLAILPTGGGKSLTYQLPALLLNGTTIVISPLMALIEDQIRALKKRGVRAARFDSTLTSELRDKTLTKIQSQEIQILYTSPESLANKELVKALKTIPIALAAVDEAHCISEWGHSFRPSYLFLPKVIRSLKPQCFLALTATATQKTASSIRKQFQIKTAHEWRASQYRSNLEYRVHPCLPETKKSHLLETLKSPSNLPAIVYVMRQQDCEEVAHFLQQNDIHARSYHAGMSTASRQHIQKAFLTDDIPVIVATIAFGMGVDKANIRSVIHYHMPKSPEGWVQESGRAGRDGKPSLCLTLACGDDRIPLENWIEAKHIRKHTIEQLCRTLFSQGRHARISPYHTRVLHDIHSSSLHVLLARIEITNTIKYTNQSWRYVRAWEINQSSSFSEYPKKMRQALQHICSLDTRYDTTQCDTDFGITAEKLWATLEELYQQNRITLIKTGWLWHYRIHPHAEERMHALIEKLYTSLHSERERDIKKLHAVQHIATHKKCIPLHLTQWFQKEERAPCGICSSCLNPSKISDLPTSHDNNITDLELSNIHSMVRSHPHLFQTNQQLTRFLCGIASPYIRHNRMHFLSEFGMLNHLSYQEVYHYAKACLNAAD